MIEPWWLQPEAFKECLTENPTLPGDWDSLFIDVAYRVAEMSKCASRQVGAILVRNKRIISMGYNGAPAGSNLCQRASYCPRKKMGFASGKGVEYCPAVHAEANCILNAARYGIATNETTLYCTNVMPCQRCAGELINAGVKEIVCASTANYDAMSKLLFESANVVVRAFGKG